MDSKLHWNSCYRGILRRLVSVLALCLTFNLGSEMTCHQSCLAAAFEVGNGVWGDHDAIEPARGLGKILAKNYMSISLGRTEKLFVDSSLILIWSSSDSSVAKVTGGEIAAKKVGIATITVIERNLGLVDTCAVTVVPWLAGISSLTMAQILRDFRLLCMIGDTLYLQGQGGKNGWDKLYRFAPGMTSPVFAQLFPTDGTFPYDLEYMLPTPFGNFALAKRESLLASRKIYRSNRDLQNPVPVYGLFPPVNGQPALSYVFHQGWSYDAKGNVYLGEYNSNDQSLPNYPIKIYKSSDQGTNWNVVYTFPPRSIAGITGGVRHVHACQVDPYSGYVWIATGDGADQARIYYHDNQLLPDVDGTVRMKLVGFGSQEFRAVSFAFTRKYIYWFMDAPDTPQKIFRIPRLNSYTTLTRNTPPQSDYRELVGTFKDKPFWNSCTVTDGDRDIIILEAAYEDAAHYGGTFREVDARVRVYGIKENRDGTAQVQELASLPATLPFAHMTPIGQDSDGNIYFDAIQINGANVSTVFRARLSWVDADNVFVPAGSNTGVPFPNTNVILSAFVAQAATVTVQSIPHLPIAGSLPEGVQSVSPFYWSIQSNGAVFSGAKISVPINDLVGVRDLTSMVFLKRSRPGDMWTNIGGSVSTDRMESTVSFTSFGEFAIGSSRADLLIDQATLDFGSTKTKQVVSRKLSIATNAGVTFLQIDSISIRPNVFSVSSSTWPIRITKGDTIRLQISFDPDSGKTYVGALSLYSNSLQFETRISLKGKAELGVTQSRQEETVPKSFELAQNYPNPFNGATTIRFALPVSSYVTLKIYDLLGREVASVLNQQLPPGEYRKTWEASHLASGVYFCHFRAKPVSGELLTEYATSKKVILLK